MFAPLGQKANQPSGEGLDIAVPLAVENPELAAGIRGPLALLVLKTLGRWDEGLPKLAKGGTDQLADAARRDLAAPDTAAAMAELADVWWDAATAQPVGRWLWIIALGVLLFVLLVIGGGMLVILYVLQESM